MKTVGSGPAAHRTRRRLAAGITAAILLTIGLDQTMGKAPAASAFPSASASVQSDMTPDGPPWGVGNSRDPIRQAD
jgi:hypothetical protein